MFESSDNLRRAAVLVGTVESGFAFLPHEGGSTFGAGADELHRLACGGAFFGIDTHDLGYNLASFLDEEPVALVDVHLLDEVGVV